MSTAVADIGAIYCSIISFAVTHHDANHKKDHERHTEEIIRSLVAIRAKLKRSIALKTNIIYEVSHRFFWLILHVVN